MFSPKRKLAQLRRDWHYRSQLVQSDVILASFPKSGNTWVAFLLAEIINRKCNCDRMINFFNISDFIPEINLFDSIPENQYPNIPRMIKTHDAEHRNFRKVFLIVRDPRDVMISYYHYCLGLNLVALETSFPEFIQSKRFGIDRWLTHTDSYLERAKLGRRVHIFKYEDLLKDTYNELKEMLIILGISHDDLLLNSAIEKCQKEKMKASEKRTRETRNLKIDNKFSFVRKGSSGQWKEENKNEIEYISERTKHHLEQFGYI